MAGQAAAITIKSSAVGWLSANKREMKEKKEKRERERKKEKDVRRKEEDDDGSFCCLTDWVTWGNKQ